MPGARTRRAVRQRPRQVPQDAGSRHRGRLWTAWCRRTVQARGHLEDESSMWPRCRTVADPTMPPGPARPVALPSEHHHATPRWGKRATLHRSPHRAALRCDRGAGLVSGGAGTRRESDTSGGRSGCLFNRCDLDHAGPGCRGGPALVHPIGPRQTGTDPADGHRLSFSVPAPPVMIRGGARGPAAEVPARQHQAAGGRRHHHRRGDAQEGALLRRQPDTWSMTSSSIDCLPVSAASASLSA